MCQLVHNGTIFCCIRGKRTYHTEPKQNNVAAFRSRLLILLTESSCACAYIYIYIYIYMCVCVSSEQNWQPCLQLGARLALPFGVTRAAQPAASIAAPTVAAPMLEV